jgi:hypothetical protein
MPVTPNVGLNTPVIGSNNWGTPLNFNFALIDRIFGGQVAIPGLNVSGDVLVQGTLTAGSFAGLDGSFFLTSALYNQPNGIPQLNGAGLIPPTLFAGLGLSVVAFSPTPVFNGANAQGFNLTLTGDVTSSSFTNGTQAPALVAFRIQQDGAGGHAFVWPPNTHGAGVVNANPNVKSQQLFMRNTDGSLDALAPIVYS